MKANLRTLAVTGMGVVACCLPVVVQASAMCTVYRYSCVPEMGSISIEKDGFDCGSETDFASLGQKLKKHDLVLLEGRDGDRQSFSCDMDGETYITEIKRVYLHGSCSESWPFMSVSIQDKTGHKLAKDIVFEGSCFEQDMSSLRFYPPQEDAKAGDKGMLLWRANINDTDLNGRVYLDDTRNSYLRTLTMEDLYKFWKEKKSN